MCFSPQASFISAAGLVLIGLLSIRKASTRPLQLLAASPLFFGIQQALEGVVWITLLRGDSTSFLHRFSVFGFLFFAVVFWPTWVPFVTYSLEKVDWRTLTLRYLLILGAFFSLTSLADLILNPIGASIANHHIAYAINLHAKLFSFVSESTFWVLTMAYYVLVAVIPFFISSLSGMWVLGTIISIGFIISLIQFYVAFGSVWCFIAAIASGLIYYIVAKNNKL